MRCLLRGIGSGYFRRYFAPGALAALLVVPAQMARADEGGVSFWIPGFFGSLAAVPAEAPGWSMTSIYYHDKVSAAGGRRSKAIAIECAVATHDADSG